MCENAKYVASFSWLLVFFVAILAGCAKKPAVKGPIEPGEYTVVDEKDNLSNISLRAYGDMQYWYALLNANPELTKRPRFDLVAGETIHVPAKQDINMKLPKSVFPKKLPADYIVMPGDSLPFIAQGCYGDRDQWMRIYDANRSTLSSKVKENPRLLIAGEVLRIPAKESGGGQSPIAPRTAQKGTVPGQVLRIPAKTEGE
jgi:nucleoid-associated protein YgaU